MTGRTRLNLGDPKAWNWLVNHVDKLITKEGIDLYRQDYNIDPLSYWRGNDTEDRQGVTENKYVTGYLAYRPEAGRGMIQAFRRSGSKVHAGQFKLRGLRPDAQYELSSTDEPGKVTVSGRQLMETGTEIAIKQRPGAAVVVYERVDRQTPR